MPAYQKQVKTLAARIMAESRRKNGKPLLNRRTATRMAARFYSIPRVIDPCCCVTFGGARWSIPAPYRPYDRVLCLPGRQADTLWILDPKESAPDIFIKQVAQEPHDAHGFTLNAAVLAGKRDTPTELTLCCERLLEIEREIAMHDRIAAIKVRVWTDGKFVYYPPSADTVALIRSLRAAAVASLKQVGAAIQQIVATQLDQQMNPSVEAE